MTVAAQLRQRFSEIDVVWCDDGIVFRVPESDSPPEAEWFIPDPESLEEDVVRALSDTSLFAARFRENAARALLLPRRFRSAHSFVVAAQKVSRFDAGGQPVPQLPDDSGDLPGMPAGRFDIDGLNQLLEDIRSRRIRVHP